MYLMLTINTPGAYGTLIDIAPELGLAPGTLKVAAYRNPDAFAAMEIGRIAGKRVFALKDVAAWHANHDRSGRPRKDTT